MVYSSDPSFRPVQGGTRIMSCVACWMGRDSSSLFSQVEPPMWAQAGMMIAVAASAAAWVHITPLYFVAGAPCSMQGGLVGAMEAVRAGGSPDYILAAIPFFLLLIATEIALTLLSDLPCVGGRYAIDDAWSSLTAGITQQMFVALVKVPLSINIIPYSWIYYNIGEPSGLAKYAPVDNLAVWIAVFLAVDCCYYWFHRLAHEVQLLWAGHGIHHQSEYYNLSTALRQSWWAALTGWVFYLPMALMVHPLLYTALEGANIVYQFWVHTCLVRRLPEPLEWIFMTPSHHRVHHDRRVHKNFGGFLIVWDRMFGSFQDEYQTVRPLQAQVARMKDAADLPQEEVMLFGSASRVQSWTEVVTQTQFWSPVVRAARERGVGLATAVVIGPGFYTTTAPRDLMPPSASATRIRKQSGLALAGKLYVVATFLAVAVPAGFIVMLFASAPWLLRAVGGSLVLFTLYCQGLLLDAEQRTGLALERVRCLICAAACFALLMYGQCESLPTPERWWWARKAVEPGTVLQCGNVRVDVGVWDSEARCWERLATAFMQRFLKCMLSVHAGCLLFTVLSPRSLLNARD